MEQKPKKLLPEQVREVMCLRHYAYRTEETYIHWLKRFILFHHKRHPGEMGCVEIEALMQRKGDRALPMLRDNATQRLAPTPLPFPVTPTDTVVLLNTMGYALRLSAQARKARLLEVVPTRLGS